MLKRRIHQLILFAIANTPLFTTVEILGYFGIDNNLDIIYIKMIKSIVMMILVFLTLLYLLYKGYMKKYILPLASLFFFTFWASVNSFGSSALLASGLRWCLPLFLTLTLIRISDQSLLCRITKILSVLIILQVVLQLYEMFYMPPFWGWNIFGLTGRLPGFFIHPNSAGVFTCFVFYFVRYFYTGTQVMKKTLLLVSVFSVFLSMSSAGTMIIIVLIVYPMVRRSKYKLLLIPVILTGLILVLFNLDLITGRGDGDSEVSIGTRMNILIKQMQATEPLSSKFGVATNTAMNLNTFADADLGNAFIADSTYTSFLINYGWIFSIITLAFLIYAIVYLRKYKEEKMTLALILIFLSSIASIMMELFPINLLIASLLSCFLYKKNNHKNDNITAVNVVMIRGILQRGLDCATPYSFTVCMQSM
jgi:hypothetical protein